MFIDFYSIHSINNGKSNIGYTEYFQILSYYRYKKTIMILKIHHLVLIT